MIEYSKINCGSQPVSAGNYLPFSPVDGASV